MHLCVRETDLIPEQLGQRGAADIPASSARPATTTHWTSDLAPMASAKLPLIYHLALAMPPWVTMEGWIRETTYEDRKRGIKSRWWRVSGAVRRRMWEVVMVGGVDRVEGDDWIG